ncbi:uncharacterized protein LOC144331233 [Macaca mulatta]
MRAPRARAQVGRGRAGGGVRARGAALSAVLRQAPGPGGEAAPEAPHGPIARCRGSCRQRPGLALAAAAAAAAAGVGAAGGGGARSRRGPGGGSRGPQTPAPPERSPARATGSAPAPRKAPPPLPALPLVRAPELCARCRGPRDIQPEGEWGRDFSGARRFSLRRLTAPEPLAGPQSWEESNPDYRKSTDRGVERRQSASSYNWPIWN